MFKTGKSGGTSGLKYHIENKHPSINCTPSVSQWFPSRVNYATSSQHKKKLDKLCLEMIVRDMRPLSSVACPGLVAFVEALDPNYKMPSRQAITGMLPQLYTRLMSELMKSAASWKFVALTTDMWTSCTMVSFISVTAHYIKEERMKSSILACNRMADKHTSSNIESFLMQTISRFQLEGKVASITTDNGANIVKAVKDSGIPHVPCFAHTLNLGVGDILKQVEELKTVRSKVSRIVSLTKKSSLAKETFIQCQRDRGSQPRVLIQECPTRWNSTFLMLQRVYEEQDAIKAFSEKFNVSSSIGALTSDEWNVVQVTLELLKPCYEFTVEMSSEKLVTSSKVLPMCKLLIKFYKHALDAENAATDSYGTPTFRLILCRSLHDAMRTRLAPFYNNHGLKMACLLDPCFKRMGFMSTPDADEASSALKSAGLAISKSIKNCASITEAAPSPSISSSLWAQLNTGMASSRMECESNFEAEYRSWYTGLEDKSTDVLKWWSTNRIRFPILYELAQKFLVIQGTSVPSERLFSSAGNIINDMRSRLSDDNAEMLIFCNSNMKPSSTSTSSPALE